MRRALLIFLALYGGSGFARLPHLTRYELRWAIFHPFAACKIKHITAKCYDLYGKPGIKQQLDSFAGGGRLDAFRHVFFMAAYAQKIKVKKLRKLGRAHEKSNYRQFLKSQYEEGETPDSLGTVMDLKNNELGFILGKENKQLPLDDLKTLVISEINKGRAVILKRNSKGNYVDCENREIDLEQFQHQWSIPKCLVASGN